MVTQGWYIHKDELQISPSRQDGISWEEELDLRRRTCMYIEEAGQELHFPKLTIATAQVFFHRFFMRQSFKVHDRYIVATTCLFLAGKVEETFKHLDQIVKIYYSRKRLKRDSKSDEFIATRKRILLVERILLHTMAFDLVITHPYQSLPGRIKTVMKLVDPATQSKTIGELERQVIQVAYYFANDSFRTTLCLQYPPDVICGAVVYLAFVFCDIRPTPRLFEGKSTWWKGIVPSDAVLDDICQQLMDMYSSHAKNDRLVEIEDIFLSHQQRAIIEEARKNDRVSHTPVPEKLAN